MKRALVRRFRLAAGALLIAAAPLGAAYANPAADPAAERLAEAAALAPGEYLWEPDRSLSGEVEVVVSLPLQRAYVYRGGVLIGVATVSTGRAGHETPVGSFNILQKRREHYSNLYDNAPMPFMQRLTWDGIALHAGHIPGEPASHGCIRLPMAFARQLFAATELGGSVHVTDLAPAPAEALAMVRGGAPVYAGMGGAEEDPGGASD